MKNKVYGIVATLFMGVLSMNAQIPKGFQPVAIEFSKISSYVDPCDNGKGFCTGTVRELGDHFLSAIQVSEKDVRLAFSQEFFEKNAQYLKEGVVVERDFSLPREVSEKLGIKGEVSIVGNTTYRVVPVEGYYTVSLQRKR